MQVDIQSYFDRCELTCEAVGQEIWHSAFATESDEQYDLFVMISDEWVHFGVSPFVSRPDASSLLRVYTSLLRLNQEMRFASFAVDSDGDINLICEWPRADFAFAQFARAVDLMTGYTQLLASDVRRLLTDPDFELSL